MIIIIKITVILLTLLTIRGIVPRYKVDVLVTVVWKHLLLLVFILLLIILV